MKLFGFTLVFIAVSLTQAQIVLDSSPTAQKNIQLTSAYMQSKEDSIFNQVKDNVVVSQAVRDQVKAALNSAINKTFTTNANELVKRANVSINNYLKIAKTLLTEFEKQVNRTNTRKPKCSIYTGKAREIYTNFINNVQLCANSTIEAVGYAGRYKLSAFFEDIGKRFFDAVTQRYLLCRGNPRNTNVTADGICKVDVSSIAILNQAMLNSYLNFGVNNAKVAMGQAMDTGRVCVRGYAYRERTSISELRRNYTTCLSQP